MSIFKCIYCGNEFEAPQKERKFCSRSCQCSFRNKNSKGKIKRSKSSIEKQKKSIKEFWDSERSIKERKNRKIRAKIQSNSPEFIEMFRLRMKNYWKNEDNKKRASEKLSKRARENIKNGTHNVWKTRNIQSYPELYVENYLLKNNIKFEKEKYISKSSLGLKENGGYFLDFYFEKEKLNLEIDGSQHNKPERIKHDKQRDEFLEKNGYKVIRIPWVSIKSKEKRNEFNSKLNEVISLL
jgi:very-short-patch-repair endonuclease